MTKLTKLLLSGRSVFTIDDLSVIWGQHKRSDTSQSAKEYVRAGSLIRIRRGVYALANAKLKPAEVANKLVVPSYLSCESVLKKHGASFQFDDRVTSAALVSKSVDACNCQFRYYQVSSSIFYNGRGVFTKDGVTQASLERAVADCVYLKGGDYPFEDLSGVNWGELAEIGGIYGKKSVVGNIERLRRIYA
jgi:predicted transcriptional regulator of viral defense system